ncbi:MULTISPECIES: MliC family protein [unclassified Bartonella]|uniref:MliC family protein n=1 Tax=Bartonella TaxID=773 RepID=UPI0035CF7937
MKKTLFNLQFLAVLSLSLFGSMSAFAGSLVIEVPDDPEPKKETVVYQCSNETKKERVEATYYTTDDIALVDLKWNGNRIIASNVVSASGAKYVGGEYVWWTKGNEASFYNSLAEDHTTPLTCVEEKSAE